MKSVSWFMEWADSWTALISAQTWESGRTKERLLHLQICWFTVFIYSGFLQFPYWSSLVLQAGHYSVIRRSFEMEFLYILLFSPLSWKLLGSMCSVRLPDRVWKPRGSCWVAAVCLAGDNHKTHKPATKQPTQLFGIIRLSWLVYPALHTPRKWAHSVLESCILFSFSR